MAVEDVGAAGVPGARVEDRLDLRGTERDPAVLGMRLAEALVGFLRGAQGLVERRLLLLEGDAAGRTSQAGLLVREEGEPSLAGGCGQRGGALDLADVAVDDPS